MKKEGEAEKEGGGIGGSGGGQIICVEFVERYNMGNHFLNLAAALLVPGQWGWDPC